VTCAENTFVSNIFNFREAWIGLDALASPSPDVFRWGDGTAPSFESWADLEPQRNDDEHCVVSLNSDPGFWADTNCTSTLDYIVEFECACPISSSFNCGMP
jgi:hypothetical protein